MRIWSGQCEEVLTTTWIKADDVLDLFSEMTIEIEISYMIASDHCLVVRCKFLQKPNSRSSRTPCFESKYELQQYILSPYQG